MTAFRSKSAHPRRVPTTVGELIAAVYEVAPGRGPERLARAARVLASEALARHLSRRLMLVSSHVPARGHA